MNAQAEKSSDPPVDHAFEISAESFDAAGLMAEIKETVERKAAAGAYRDLRIAQAERTNLANLGSGDDFLKYYLDCLHSAVFVDINDFEICERRRWGAALLVTLKKAIWHMLKFYTYRLWSQQNQVNGLLVTAIESLDARYRSRIETLERKVATRDQTSCSAETKRAEQ